jgi:hypothetical protein
MCNCNKTTNCSKSCNTICNDCECKPSKVTLVDLRDKKIVTKSKCDCNKCNPIISSNCNQAKCSKQKSSVLQQINHFHYSKNCKQAIGQIVGNCRVQSKRFVISTPSTTNFRSIIIETQNVSDNREIKITINGNILSMFYTEDNNNSIEIPINLVLNNPIIEITHDFADTEIGNIFIRF